MRPTTEQLQKINALSLEKQFFADEVEVFTSLLIDENVTSYFSVVKEDAKRAFLRDIVEGRTALNLLHASREVLPVGRGFDGILSNGILYGQFYIPIGAKIATTSGGEIETDSVISQIKSGVYKATSIEFFAPMEDYTCSICGNKYYSSDCTHYAGQTYTVKNNIGVDEDRLCVVYVGNESGQTSLAATSLVISGAVRDAQFIPVEIPEQSASAFALKSESEIGGKKVMFTFKPELCKIEKKLELSSQGGNKMADKKVELTLESYTNVVGELSTVKTELANLKAANTELTTKLEEAQGAVSEFDSLKTEMAEAKEKATAMEEFRKEILVLVKEYGVKAKGAEFDEEAVDKMDDKAVVEAFKANVTEFMRKFPAGQVSPDEEGEYEAPKVFGAFKS